MTRRAHCATKLCHPPVPHAVPPRSSWRNASRPGGTQSARSCATPSVLNVQMAQQTLCHMPSDLRCYTRAPYGGSAARAQPLRHPNPHHRPARPTPRTEH